MQIKVACGQKQKTVCRRPLSSMLSGLGFLGWKLLRPSVQDSHRQEKLWLRAGDPGRWRQLMERRLEEMFDEEATSAVTKRRCCTGAEAQKALGHGIEFQAKRKRHCEPKRA